MLARAPERARTAITFSPLYYLSLTWSANVQIGAGMVFTMTAPAGTIVNGTGYYLALYDPAQAQPAWQTGLSGPVVSTDGVTLAFVISTPLSFIAQATYVMAVYTSSTPAPSPTPTATVAPVTPTPSSTSTPTTTPTPGAGFNFSPASLNLGGIGPTYAASTVVSESGYSGTITVTSTCNGSTPVASVSPSSGNGPSLTVTVTGVNGGTCTATAADMFGQLAPLSISVNAGGVIIQRSGIVP